MASALIRKSSATAFEKKRVTHNYQGQQGPLDAESGRITKKWLELGFNDMNNVQNPYDKPMKS